MIALWDSRQRGTQDYVETTLHQSLEVIMNYYGLKLYYLDIANKKDRKFLKEVDVNDFRGIVTWFNGEEVSSPETLLETFEKFSLKKPILQLGSFGILEIKRNTKLLQRFDKIVKEWGIDVTPSFVGNPLLISIQKKSKDAEFERPLDQEILKAREVHNKSKKNDVWLSLNVQGYDDPFDVIIIGKWGGYVQSGFDIFTHPKTFRAQWRVNPFKLVKNIFLKSDEVFPIPDTTTLCGRRMYFSHIDGDGFINVSNIDRKSLSGEIIYNEIIKKQKLPVTASVVVAEVDPKILGSQKTLELSKRIFKDPLVEPASHTFSHPLSWSQEPSQREKEAYLDDDVISKHNGAIVAYKVKNYVMSYEREVQGSLDFINSRLTPREKSANILLWSGSCMPPKEAMELLNTNLNMNGGDSRFDILYDSYNNLSSLYRKVGKFTQVYSAASNENLYTNLWTGPFNGFKDLIQTIRKTEKPHRIKPINVYYHFYSGEHQSSLDALNEIFDYVKKAQPTPVFASQYIKTVNDFENIEIKKESENKFIIFSNGNLRTLRLDSKKWYPDYQLSKNVIGHFQDSSVTYISLAQEQETTLVLTKEKPSKPYISQCNGVVDQFQFSGNLLKIKGYSRTPFEIDFWNGQKVVNRKFTSIGNFERELSINEAP